MKHGSDTIQRKRDEQMGHARRTFTSVMKKVLKRNAAKKRRQWRTDR